MPTETNKIIEMAFGIMKEKDISKTELAKRLHWTKSKLSKVLNNGQKLTTDDLYDLSAALGVGNPAILLKADINAVEDPLLYHGMLKDTLQEFINVNDYSEQRQLLENKVVPVFSNYLSLLSDGKRAVAKSSRTRYNSASMAKFIERGEEVPIHWNVSVQDINSLIERTNKLTVGLYWNRNRTGVDLAIVMKDYSAGDEKIMEIFTQKADETGDGWELQNLKDDVYLFGGAIICSKHFSVVHISDELGFKTELIKAYDLYSDFVKYYMDMIIHGYYDNQAVTSANERFAQQVNAVRVRNKKAALKQLGYTCEIDPTHESFTNPETGKRYMKAVYLIPGSEGLDIEWDQISNICCLCPNCAERIRYGTDSDRQEMLTTLYFKHKNDLERDGISMSLMQIFKLNGME